MSHKRDKLCRCRKVTMLEIDFLQYRQKIKRIQMLWQVQTIFQYSLSDLPNIKALTFQGQIHTVSMLQACYKLILQHQYGARRPEVERQYSKMYLVQIILSHQQQS